MQNQTERISQNVIQIEFCSMYINHHVVVVVVECKMSVNEVDGINTRDCLCLLICIGLPIIGGRVFLHSYYALNVWLDLRIFCLKAPAQSAIPTIAIRM